MSDREELAAILFGPDDDDATPEPADGQPRVRAAQNDEPAEDEDDDSPLSPEELVAEAARQDAAEHGEDSEEADEPAEADADEPDDELAQLREKARLYDEQQQRIAEEALSAEETKLEHERTARKASAKVHYARELQRLLDAVDADAENTPNPAAYKQRHRPAVINAVAAQQEAWLGQIDADIDTRQTVIFHERNKPLFADHLMQWALDTHGMPLDPRVKTELVKKSVDDMPARIQEIVFNYLQWQERNQVAEKQQREVKAAEVKKSQPHASSATSRPRRKKPVEYAASGSERLAQLRAIEAMR